jgi:PAS domain S-box-containing protein
MSSTSSHLSHAISTSTASDAQRISRRTAELFQDQKHKVFLHTDRLFVHIMLFQWVAGIAAAVLLSPRAWTGTQSTIHLHVFAAVILGGLFSSLPVALALCRPGLPFTRHTIAVGQMLMSALLIHLTGGRIETHFHVFGSLAILAFYRDWRVLISASAVVYIDHLARGMFWPQSVYGVLAAPVWRSLEHAGWVIFEVTFLILSIRTSLSETLAVAERQARLETLKVGIEATVAQRTEELLRENAERRQAEADLKQSEAQLAEAQRIARLGSWEWDVQSDKVTYSEETRRLYGMGPKLFGASLDKNMTHVHPDDRARVLQALAHSVRTGQMFVCDHRVLLGDGTERIMHGLANVVRNERGEAVKLIGTTQDITESKRAEEALHRSEEQLRQAQKMEAVGRLAGGVAHDFNNLLTVITGFSAICIHSLPTNHPLRKNLDEIQNASERAASLTAQLLAFSRKQVLKPRILKLNTIVSGMEKMLRRLIGEDIELSTNLEPQIGSVKADPGQIEQVILNLAVNARDAMPQGGKLIIRTANVMIDEKSRFRGREMDSGPYILLAVSDTGVGMTDEVKAHLFEPFFTTKGIGRGTGLGLATCYGIVRQSEGDIRVYSEPNRGTTFKVYLPRVDTEVESSSKPASDDSMPQGTESILIVEDDAAVRRLATTVLRDRGYKVHEARDGAEALDAIGAGQHFDLVVTDVIMPKMSGKDLSERIRATTPQTKVLFMSGYTDDALALHGVLAPEIVFLEKPFSPARLARKVRETIDFASG